MPRTTGPIGGRRRAFTLIEILLVIAIIGVLIAILVPALGGAREAARKAQSQTLLTSLGNAVGAFGNDNDGRAPGLFGVRDMGHSDNGGMGGEGLSAMENMLLALSGSEAVLGRNDVSYNGEVNQNIVALVGPLSASDSKYWVNPSLIGTGDAYFDISPEFFVAQTRGEQQAAANAGPAANEDERAMGMVEIPDLVDAWGQPILAWVKDEFGATQIRQSATNITLEREKFVQIDSDGADGNTGPAWFYWNSNAAFLRATALGKKRYDMSAGPSGTDGAASIIGGGMREDDPDHMLYTMAALLGASSFSSLQDAGGSPYMSADLIPTSARGSVVLHSAGRDGIYLSTEDSGLATATVDGDHIEFGSNFYGPGTEDRILDDAGKPTSVDVITDFDDLITGVGN